MAGQVKIVEMQGYPQIPDGWEVDILAKAQDGFYSRIYQLGVDGKRLTPMFGRTSATKITNVIEKSKEIIDAEIKRLFEAVEAEKTPYVAKPIRPIEDRNRFNTVKALINVNESRYVGSSDAGVLVPWEVVRRNNGDYSATTLPDGGKIVFGSRDYCEKVAALLNADALS